MPKMRLIPDCGECEDCEMISESESYQVERLVLYCSHPTLDNPIIWETRNDTRPPNWTIPDWCPLQDSPVETDEKNCVLCVCPDHWEDCKSGVEGRCVSLRLK